MNEKTDGYGNVKYQPKKEFNTTPPFMRSSVSNTFIMNNPKYADLFHQCPKCNKNSFCNRDLYARQLGYRRCRECGFEETKD